MVPVVPYVARLTFSKINSVLWGILGLSRRRESLARGNRWFHGVQKLMVYRKSALKNIFVMPAATKMKTHAYYKCGKGSFPRKFSTR